MEKLCCFGSSCSQAKENSLNVISYGSGPSDQHWLESGDQLATLYNAEYRDWWYLPCFYKALKSTSEVVDIFEIDICKTDMSKLMEAWFQSNVLFFSFLSFGLKLKHLVAGTSIPHVEMGFKQTNKLAESGPGWIVDSFIRLTRHQLGETERTLPHVDLGTVSSGLETLIAPKNTQKLTTWIPTNKYCCIHVFWQQYEQEKTIHSTCKFVSQSIQDI